MAGSRAALGRRRAAADDTGVEDLLDDLASLGVETAPHVAAELHRELGGDGPTIREVASTLTPAQRAGSRALPEPLPCVPPISAVYSQLSLTVEDHETLLLASLSTDSSVGTLLAAAGRSPADLLTSSLSAHLLVAAGRFAWRDPRFRVWMLGTSPAERQNAAHERLSVVHALQGDEVRAAWHRARAALVKRPETVAVLLPVARRLSEDGELDSAFRVATEVFDHAGGEEADAARLIAGTAALGSGRVEDAVDWLGSLFSSASAASTEEAMAGLILAETLAAGVLPMQDPAERRPRGGDERAWTSWGRAAAMAAVLCAERQAIPAMRTWLQEAREADVRAQADGAIRDPAVALCWLLSREGRVSEEAPATMSQSIASAVGAALDGDVEGGLEMLAVSDAMPPQISDPFLAGTEQSPLSAAYRAVTEVLLRIWQGDIATARERLLHAAARWPVALPYAGLGAHLARRLDLAVHGRPAGLSLSLTASLPPGIRLDSQVDLAIEAYLAGAVEDAADHARIWHDRGAPAPVLTDGGIDEVGPHMANDDAVEPGEAARARLLCHRIRGTVPAAWQHEYADIAEQSRQIRSPFRRGRVEALLGTTCVIRGDRAAGRRHLRMARRLFADAGADAWRISVEARLARLGDRLGDACSAAPASASALDPLAACRAAWSDVLTQRELQVAMLIVGGAANREIAERLDLSIRTVEVHAGHVFGKLDVRGRVELTVLAHRTNQHI
ncbi:helix-turn-helix transcriptional regulator [Microbacterium tumbae]